MKKTVCKILSVLLTVALLAGTLGLDAVFAAAAPMYTVKNATGYVGQKVCTTLTVKNIAGLQSGSVVLEYDKSVLDISGDSYTITQGTIGLQSKLTEFTSVLGKASYYPGAQPGKGYVSYTFYANNALAKSNISRVDVSELPLAVLFFTVKAKKATTTKIDIVEAKAQVGDTLSAAGINTTGTVTIKVNPVTAYDTSKTNDAGQYTGVSVTNDIGAATTAAFTQTNVGGISANAFGAADSLVSLCFTPPVIDGSSQKDPAAPTEYPQAAFKDLKSLKSISIDLTKGTVNTSRFFTDNGVIYIRDVDASGNLLDTCKVYLIPYNHPVDVYLSNNVTGVFNGDEAAAFCGKTKSDFTFHHKTHVDDAGTVTKAPTCTATGTREYVCAFCDEPTRSETVPKLGHKWGAWTVTTQPTCEADGVETRVCKRNSAHKETRAVAATGHAWGAWKDNGKGQHVRVCANDKKHVETVAHVWDGGVVKKAATCKEPGEMLYTCTACAATKVEPIAVDAANHADYGTKTVKKKAAACTEEGYTGDVVCLGCGAVLTPGETIPATGHAWGEWKDNGEGGHVRVCANDKKHVETVDHAWDGGAVQKAATCKEPGEMLYTCTVCAATKVEPIAVDAANHADYGTKTVKKKAAACTEEGYTGDVVCLGCGAVLTPGETIPATGHAWGEWKDNGEGGHVRVCANDKKHVETVDHVWDGGAVQKAPTCKEPGEMLYTCTECAATKVEPIAVDPANHADYETKLEKAKAATCTKAGYTGDTVCTACGAVVVPGEEIPALGHDWGDWETVTEPDCVTPGSRIRHCKTNKKHSETEEIPALGHTWQNEEILKSATCREEGLKKHDCAVCGVEEEFAYSDANAHIWVQNGTQFFVTVWKCTICGETRRQNNKPDSSYVEIVTEPPVTEPTTEAPTTEAPTTEAPTTEAPTTEAPTTAAPTTAAPTTAAPTTAAPTTAAPTTAAPTTAAPTTAAPTTQAPATEPTVPVVPSSDPTEPTTSDTEPKVFYQLGDVNMDGKINSSDARLALRAAAKVETLSELQMLLADVSGDSKVKASDARTILRIAARLEPKPETMIPA